MRIWIFNHYADPPDGLATRSFDIASRLTEAGHPSTIFVSNFSHYYFKPMRELGWRLWRRDNLNGVAMVWLRTTPYRDNGVRRILNMASYAVLAVSAAATFRERPDVVIGVSVHPLAALAGYFVARSKRARFVVEITDLWPETLIQLGRLSRNSVAARLMLRLERFLYRRAERIIMLWRNTDDYVESVGVSHEKIVWIPHGVELQRYAGVKPYDGGRTPLTIMYLGAMVGSMSLDTVVDAAAILDRRGHRDSRFVLIGSGVERQRLMDRVQMLGLPNVEFRPAVQKEQIAQVMNCADAFIHGTHDLPLYRFGMSTNKGTDYLAGGRPIIYFGGSSYDPVSLIGAGFKVRPNDPTGIADAVEQLVALTPDERVAMGKRGRAYLEDHHTIPVLTARLLATLTQGQS